MAKAAELRQLADTELEQRRNETVQELFNLRFQLVTGQLENVSRLRELRREVARVLTIQGERAREAAGQVQGADAR
ncbi:MAG: 50S ribosomal protein L29 [Actinomycetota bacterium]|nr:50S ribosomal protein L29 [Actinomycetota bacterium]